MVHGIYPGVRIVRNTFNAPQNKILDFTTLFFGFYDDEEYFVFLKDMYEAHKNTFLKQHPDFFNAVKHYFDNGGIHLYILNYPKENSISLLSITKFLQDKCDNLNDLEIICTVGLIHKSSVEIKQMLEVINAVNTYATQTDRISLSDISNALRKDYLDRLGETVIYYPWFVDAKDKLVSPAVIAAALSSKLASEGSFFHSIANKPIVNLQKISQDLSKSENQKLYEDGINPIVYKHKDGLRIWGVKPFNSKYESVNEMRVLKYIKRQLKRISRDYIFESNSQELSGKIFIKVSHFLSKLWEAGALSGNSKQEAFSIFTHINNLDNNRSTLLFEVSVAISKPLEFIVIRLNRIDNNGAQESLSVK